MLSAKAPSSKCRLSVGVYFSFDLDMSSLQCPVGYQKNRSLENSIYMGGGERAGGRLGFTRPLLPSYVSSALGRSTALPILLMSPSRSFPNITLLDTHTMWVEPACCARLSWPFWPATINRAFVLKESHHAITTFPLVPCFNL